MIVFLLKSSACLAIFLMFYTLLLEKEHMHTFKRYYLLAALVLALVIPSITFTEYVEIAPTSITIAPAENSSTNPAMTVPENATALEVYKTGIDYWPLILWAVYGLGVLLFSLKFIFNLWKIVRNIRNNPKLKIDTLINVLLKDAIVPHTFLNYIFLNRQKFKAHEIPKDVLIHEATHALQKHSYDILFVELIQIVFWFNPLIHFAKKSIKLNHEFLADQAVLDQGASAPHYQNTLLTFASSANYKDHQPSMANAINYSSYSSIKKRFKVMKTQTSKKSILVRSLLIFPLFALLLYGFSTKVEIPKEHPKTSVSQEGATKIELSKFNSLAEKYNAQPQENRVIPSEDLKMLEDIYGKMTEEQKTDALPFPECSDPKSSNQEGATIKQIGEYNELAKTYNTMLADKGNIRIKKSEVDRLEYLYGIMTEDQRAEAEPFPEFPEPPAPPAPALPPFAADKSEKEAAEEMIQYIIENQDPQDDVSGNVRLSGDHSGKKKHFPHKDHSMIRTVEEVKNKNEVIQETIAEERPLKTIPFRHIATDEETKIYLNGKEITYAEMKKMEEDVTITSMNIVKKSNGNSVIELEETSHQPPAPPTPPKPKSPLELLKELKEDNVKVILDGKEIGYEEAEKLFEENTFSRINVSKKTGERTVLEVSTD